MKNSTKGFEEPIGWLAGRVMDWMNRDMELTALEELPPEEQARVLLIGSGPGVGIAELAARRPRGMITGADPSPVRVRLASQRNQRAIEAGQVALRQAGAGMLPWKENTFDGVLAVNRAQFWRPLPKAVLEITRVLRPTGSAVIITQ